METIEIGQKSFAVGQRNRAQKVSKSFKWTQINRQYNIESIFTVLETSH